MSEIVYIITNESMPGLIKIGRTNSDLAERIRALYQTGVPLPFELYYACEVNDSQNVERKLHDAFDDHRLSKNREFFRIAPERARAAMSLAAIKEIRLGDELFASPEDKAEVEAEKRRGRFRFYMIGIEPGTQLELYRDRNITCETVDNINKVDFRGSIASLSDAAGQALKDLGLAASVSGPWEWSFNGKRLDDMRREIEEKSD
jgi:hypothetical protein